MSEHESVGTTEGIPLPPLLEVLRGRCQAVARFQGGRTYYAEEFAEFFAVAREAGFLQPQKQEPGRLAETPDYEGNEHQVWFEQETRTFLKATWPDFFGLKVIHAADDDERASPIDYLERWHLHNELFFDNVRFLGAILLPDGKHRLLIRQPAIKGVPATTEQIADFFISNGWNKFMVRDEVAFFDPERHVVISDTHRGNLILMEDGLLAPIDLRVQHLSGALLDTVVELCR